MLKSSSRSHLPNWLTKKNSRAWNVIEEEANPNSFKVKSRTRSHAIVPRSATAEAKAYGRGEVHYTVAPKCKHGATCSSNTCTDFHGAKECNFVAGKKIDERRWLPGGKSNPRFKKPMLCNRGASCAFNHRSATRKAKTERKIYEKARLEQAPVLKSEADLTAAYPTLEYKAASAWSTDEMSPLDKECLERSLKKSPQAEHTKHGDYIEINFKSSRGSR
jgi:hypothetical protein